MSRLSEEDFIPIKKYIFIIFRNWQWFLLSTCLCLLFSLLINRYSANIYSNSIKMNIINSSNADPLESILGTKNPEIYSQNFSDKMFMITSYPLIYKTINDLNLNIEYFVQGNIKTAESYNYRPITFTSLNFNQNFGQEFMIKLLNKYQYSIESEKLGKAIYEFDNEIITDYGSYIVSLNDYFDTNLITDYPTLIVKVKNPHNITKLYKSKIKLNRISKDASIVNITVTGEDILKETEFLNKLCENYIQNDLNTKNEVSKNTIDFIENQLNQIKDSLNFIEAQLQIFKKNNGVVQISVESENFYDDIKRLQNEKSKIIIENKYFDYLSEYLNKKSSLEDVIIPVSYGISDKLLNDLIDNLVELQLERKILNPNGLLRNPAISDLDGKIDRLKSTLNDMILNLKSKNNILLNDFSSRIKVSEDMLKTLPSVERELINIKRHYDLSENIYLLLMTKKTEAGILSAGNVPDAKIIEPAIVQSGIIVSPNKSQNNLFAFFIGILFPLLIFIIKELLNNKIVSPLEIESKTKIPYLGFVSTSNSGFEMIVNEKPKSRIAESFRNIRSNIEFIVPKDNCGKVILVTSSISGEGKTFCAKNLGTVYAMSGKKTLLIGADMRKPKLYLSFSKNNDIGLSTFISGNSEKNEIIFKTSISNLDYIKSGPIPPNPAELSGREETKKLINDLKLEYDYLIIDTPPVNIVSDPLPLMDIVDLNIFIVRHNYTKLGLLDYMNNFYDSNKIKNISILLNDVDFLNTYGYKYGYNYGYDYIYNYDNSYYDED
ncbi:MAG: hypothetical protein CMP70_00190 [Flavobacteriales bacterium]|nr:hypothetical protein [Flavobacteriales bacterium]